jgi:hypothetical protein
VKSTGQRAGCARGLRDRLTAQSLPVDLDSKLVRHGPELDRLIRGSCLVSSVVGEHASGRRHRYTEANPGSDTELGGGAPAPADGIMHSPRMLAGRAVVRGRVRAFGGGGGGSTHVESVKARGSRKLFASNSPTKCLRKSSLVEPTLAPFAARSDPEAWIRACGGRRASPVTPNGGRSTLRGWTPGLVER